MTFRSPRCLKQNQFLVRFLCSLSSKPFRSNRKGPPYIKISKITFSTSFKTRQSTRKSTHFECFLFASTRHLPLIIATYVFLHPVSLLAKKIKKSGKIATLKIFLSFNNHARLSNLLLKQVKYHISYVSLQKCSYNNHR